ncbi:MAG: UDP-N-acetylmuramoyl-tripeptide--D-alanyl-D-alanine ligase [Marinifilaceae bacterium]|jgi:UDP-N-acetylmuramoyl-tripeptide--D-alanyl-D-alanine ligase|nr:UDP-N-acetylmuramoyl-tripeptide--D-alanyl-D-alanine ligase [Marinifilaceae bacterium]
MNIKEIYSVYLEHSTICTDTRKIVKDSLFFALKGENFNGNTFADKALELGCSFAIVDEDIDFKSDRIIKVDDVLTCLQDLARYHRDQIKIPIIGITGTNGKTTTKELIFSVLSTKFKTFATAGNLNNHIGVPLSILSIKDEHEIAIIEMGANHPYEIAFLCTISKPNLGVITNIGKAHLEGFGNIETVTETKKALYNHLNANDGIIFYNQSNDILSKLEKTCKTFSYGSVDSDNKGELISSSPYLVLELLSKKGHLLVKTNLIGSYNFENVMAAVSIGHYFDIDDMNIKKALENYIPSNHRSQLIKTENNTIIMDSYNANPTSMKAAIENFTNMTFKNKSLLLGDMFELGENSDDEHRNIIKLIEDGTYTNIFLVGNHFFNIDSSISIHKFEETNQLLEYLSKNKIQDQIILIKGSRGMKLERCLDYL